MQYVSMCISLRGWGEKEADVRHKRVRYKRRNENEIVVAAAVVRV
jgi:hypothetical protein